MGESGSEVFVKAIYENSKRPTEDWSGMIRWMKDHHSRILLFIWNRYMKYEEKHDYEYMKKREE